MRHLSAEKWISTDTCIMSCSTPCSISECICWKNTSARFLPFSMLVGACLTQLLQMGFRSCFTGVSQPASYCWCHDLKVVSSNLHQYSEKKGCLTESVQYNTFLLAWAACRLRHNKVAYYSTPFYVNLDLFSHAGGGESGCIQNASRSSAGASASQAQDRGNQVLPAGAVELLRWDCFLSPQRDALSPAQRKGSRSWPAAISLTAARISLSCTLPLEKKGFHLLWNFKHQI